MELIGDGDVGRLAVAQRLREVRQHLGLSHADVAEYIGMGPDEVVQIETGARSVECLELRRLATLYACPVNYLLGMEDPSTGTTSALNRVLGELRTEDHERILRFAQLLRRQHTRAPQLRLVKPGEVAPASGTEARVTDTHRPRTRRID